MNDTDPTTQPPIRQSGYNVTGHTYERGNYSSRIARAYHRRRCETLQAAIDENLPTDRPLRILEIGCGTGLTLDFLAQNPAQHEIWGLDFSATMLGHALAKTRESANPARIVVGNAMEIPFPDGAFDVVYGTRFIHQFHHDAKKKIFEEVARVSGSGALLGFECYSRPYNHFRYLTDQRNKYASRDEYFSHYPSRDEIDDLTGGDHVEVSLRFGFGRWINRILGYRAYCAFNNATTIQPMKFLRDEYWVFATGPEKSLDTSLAGVNAGLELLRCARCKGDLASLGEPPRLRCDSCDLEYAVEDGLPNMLGHEAKPAAASPA